MAVNPGQAFIWGSGGAQMTPEEITAQRKVAQAMLAQGADYTPVQSWTQGAARVAQAMFGGLQAHDANEAAKTNAANDATLLASLFGGGAPAPAPAPVAAATPATSIPPMGRAGPTVPNDANAIPGTVGMNQRLADASQDFIQDNPGTSMSSGVRSTADQARLYAARGSNPNPVAFPGTSQHERGMAVDIGGMTPEQRAQLPQYGLAQPIANDPVHVQLVADPAALPANSQPTQGFAIPGQATPTVNPRILTAMSSPYVSDGTKKILGLVLSQQMEAQKQANDPLRQLQIREAQTKLTPFGAPETDAQGNLVQTDALGKVTVLNPAEKAPSTVGEYKFYADQETKAGRTPLPYGQWDVARRRSGATNVNTGTIPQGYQQVQDPITGAISLQPIPGGPHDTAKLDQAKADAQSISGNVVINAAKQARDALAASGLPAAGSGSSVLSNMGETNAAELRRQIDVLKANASIETLNQMRQMSKTGGALGSVTEGEERLLAAKSGAIDPSAPPAKVRAAIDDYERTLLETVHGKVDGDKIFEATRKTEPKAQSPAENAIAVNPQTGERLIRRGGKWVPFT